MHGALIQIRGKQRSCGNERSRFICLAGNGPFLANRFCLWSLTIKISIDEKRNGKVHDHPWGEPDLFTRISERYRGRTAVVIGAGGIGGAIARLLADQISKLVVADQNEELLQTTSRLVDPAKLLTYKLNVCDPLAVDRFFAELDSTAGPPDYLFYTAGILNLERLSETSSVIWDRAVDVNLNGAFYCIQAASARMRLQKKGSIIVMGSIAGTKARSGSRVNPVYKPTKAGLAAFVNAAAMQLRSDGVRINCISPGPTATSMMEQQPPTVQAAVNEIAMEGRMNDPSEVAEFALFVAAHGRFTGEDLCMGGGAGLGG